LGAVAGRLIRQTMQKFPEEWERYVGKIKEVAYGTS
jgi:hypothetical protein